MRIKLDSEKCQGHGRCYSLAPSLFESDDEGYAVLIGGEGNERDVPAEHEREARLAVDNCPEFAITLD
ncbi:MAG TPA: ferredoxin [Acidimicrobiales bacterium]|jgi:ferredoxin|nr:ferredoxin [Acidimicrobiales bacterium]